MAVDTSGWQLIATFPDTIYMAGTTWAQIPLHVPAGHAAKARRLLEEHGDI